VVVMKIGRKIIVGIVGFIILNMVIDYIVNSINFEFKLWVWDFSSILKTTFVGIINLITGVILVISTRGGTI